MKFIKKITPVIITSCLFTVAAIASQSDNQTSEYSITLMKDCQVISKYKMNTKQINAYLALKEQEDVMESLEMPINAIESELDEYSNQIEELTSLAIQENDDRLTIDKHYLAQQEEVVEKLNALMEAHQKDFDALGEQGSKISEIANEFTDSIKVSIGDVDYDHIRVNSPDEKQSGFHCYSDTVSI